MFITFHGAAHEVTGSCSLLETQGMKILIDCGMYQGNDIEAKKNELALPFDARELDAVLVTHAHLDHVGRLPLLTKNGFEGHFYATAPTIELARLIMEDALSVMTYDHRKTGRPIIYSQEDIAAVVSQFKPVEYGEELNLDKISSLVKVGAFGSPLEGGAPSMALGGVLANSAGGNLVIPPGRASVPPPRGGIGTGDDANDIRVIFHDAGHIFGSAFIEIKSERKRVVFSGDIGNVNVPILRDTESLPRGIDALVCESTYGDRLHQSVQERQETIEKMIAEAINRGGVLMIPSFSLERTQELIYELNDLIDRKHKLPRVPIFLDSPLAIDATKVYRKFPEYYDEQAEKFFKDGDDLFNFPGLTLTYTRDESMKINHTPGAKIIIAGAGMMNGGRIVHHALRYLSDERNTLLIIGYQSHGTLGRKIEEGESPVRVLNEEVEVRCQIKVIGALSAHGDQEKLLNWIGGGAETPKKVYLNHGDPAASDVLAKRVINDLGVKATVVNAGLKVEV